MKRISQLLRNLFISTLVSISLLFVSSCSSNEPIVEPNLDVVIEIVCDEHVSTKTDNPQAVKKGEMANFKLDFEKGYEFFESTEGTYDEETSILSIPSDMGNMTTKVSSVNTSGFKLTVLLEGDDSSYFTLSPEKEFYQPYDEVKLSVADMGRKFLCYTYDTPYRNGDCGISGVPFSFDKESTIIIEKDTVVYANFFSDNSLVIEYELNGGHTKNHNGRILADSISYDSKHPWLYRNTINLSSYAFRDGYILDSLNTRADGSGIRIGIGSRVDINLFTNGHLTLYAQWVECASSDLFTINSVGPDTAEIESFSPFSGERLAVPSEIDGKKIVGIKSNAFFPYATSIRELYLPDTIEYVEDYAFMGMSFLRDFHFYSSIERISKTSFEGTDVRKLYLNKNTYPTDATAAWDNLSGYKETILNLDSSKPNVIAVGHSTIRLNHNLDPLVDAYGNNYNFFIYGAAAGIDGYLLVSSLMDALRSQDYMILPMWPLMEAHTVGPRNLTFIQYDFDCLLNMEYEYLQDFFWESFVAYRELCTKEIGIDAYQIESHNIKNFNSTGGDYEDLGTDDPDNGKGMDYTNFLNDCKASDYQYLHHIFDKLPFDNSHILLTWSPYNQNCISDNSGYQAYETTIRNEFSSCSFFDSQLDNIYPGNYFQINDFFHLSRYGASKRIEKWVTQLNPYFSI